MNAFYSVFYSSVYCPIIISDSPFHKTFINTAVGLINALVFMFGCVWHYVFSDFFSFTLLIVIGDQWTLFSYFIQTLPHTNSTISTFSPIIIYSESKRKHIFINLNMYTLKHKFMMGVIIFFLPYFTLPYSWGLCPEIYNISPIIIH